MSVIKIALSGGPSSGKTKTMEYLKSILYCENNNYFFNDKRCIFMPEMASTLILGGITMNNCKSHKDFQELIFDLQLNTENIVNSAPEAMPDEDFIIIYDRGLPDGGAYISQNEFEDILNYHNLSRAVILERYDYVVFFESSSLTYTTADNQAREESVEEGLELSKLCRNMWQGHRNFISLPVKETLQQKQESFFEIFKKIVNATSLN